MADKRTIRTVNTIRQTFKDMIIERNEVFFSIKDIAERAGINRKTFYLHFQCIEDLYLDLEKQTENRLLQIMESKDFFQMEFSMDTFLLSIFELINENRKLYEKLLIDDNYKFLFRNVKDKIKEKMLSTLKISETNLKADMCAEYIFSGLMKLFRVWAKRKDEMTQNEMIETANKLVQNGLNAFKENF